MIELTEQQLQALDHPDSTPPRVVDPRTKETFVLLRVDEYERLKEEYDDSDWTREELQALAWEKAADRERQHGEDGHEQRGKVATRISSASRTQLDNDGLSGPP